jgi:hypothetical protein
MARWRALCPAQSSQSEPELPTPHTSCPHQSIYAVGGTARSSLPGSLAGDPGAFKNSCPVFFYAESSATGAVLRLGLLVAGSHSCLRSYALPLPPFLDLVRQVFSACEVPAACPCVHVHCSHCTSCVQQLRQRAAWPWRQRQLYQACSVSTPRCLPSVVASSAAVHPSGRTVLRLSAGTASPNARMRACMHTCVQSSHARRAYLHTCILAYTHTLHVSCYLHTCYLHTHACIHMHVHVSMHA